MARRTQEQIDNEIAALRELIPQMPNYRSGIEIALRVLEHNLSVDTVFEAYEGDELFDDAHSTLVWRDGQSKNVPSELYREML